MCKSQNCTFQPKTYKPQKNVHIGIVLYLSSVSKDPFNLSCMHHFSTPFPHPLIVCMHTHNVLDFSNKIYILFLLSAWLSGERFPLPLVSHQTHLNGPFRTSTSMLMSACSGYAAYKVFITPAHPHARVLSNAYRGKLVLHT